MLAPLLNQPGASRLPGIEFAQPVWLILIPLLSILAWWIARNALGGWRGGPQTVHLIARCIVIALLAAALAEPGIRWPAKDVTVVVVHDVSRSIPADQQRRADQFLRASIENKRAGDRLGLITTASDAFVQSLPTTGQPRLDTGFIGDTGATDLEQGIRLAGALVPADTAGRILIISDGNQTRGSLTAAVNAAHAGNIPIDVAAIEYDRSRQVRLQEVVVPAWARENTTVNTRIMIESGRTVSGRLTIMMNGTLVSLDPESDAVSIPVELNPGLNTFTVPLQLTDAPVHEIEAYFEPDTSASGDDFVDIPELLRSTGVTFTSSRGRVLILAEPEDEQGLAPFLDAIRSEDLVIDVRPAEAAPASLTELAGYDAIILANQPASNFSQAQHDDLVSFVHDAGGGLLVLGGPNSFGAGGWIGSTLAEALPVRLDPPQKRQMPMGALAIVLDCSGSMSSPVSGTNLNQQQVANQAAILGVRALSRLDQVAVIAFSGSSQVVVPLTSCSDPESIAQRIRSIAPSGGTNLFPAIDAAAAELAKSPAGIKHIIILTDGQTMGDPRDGQQKAAALKERGITISTVAVGDASNDQLLRRLAFVSGGRSYSVTSANSLAVLPQIFIKEAQTIRRALIWEGPPFSATPAMAGEAMRGITGPFPATFGYVVTADRGGLSTVALRGPENDPILAYWQHGLGRVTAYTSDAATRWNAPWTSWAPFAAFWRQQLHWTMRPTGDPRARINVETSGDRSRISLELFDDNGQRINFAQIRGRAIHPDSEGHSGTDVTLRQVGPGRYEGELEAASKGVHIVSLRYDAPVATEDGTGVVRRQGAVRTAIVRRGGDELRQPTPDTELLWQAARQTNGRIHRLDPAGADLWTRDDLTMPTIHASIWLLLALAGIAAFLADVAVRRIAIDPNRIAAWSKALFIAAPIKRPESLESLSTAKARAAESMRRSEDGPAPLPHPHSPRPPSTQPGDIAIITPLIDETGSTSGSAPPAKEPPKPEQSENVMDRLRAAKKRSLNE